MLTTKNKGGAKFVGGQEFIVDGVNTTTVRNSVVSTFPSPPSDPTESQVLGLIEQSEVLDFWNRADEDVYTREDGEAI